jgi:hypothetical protein
LWPEKVRQADLERLKVELGPYRYTAQAGEATGAAIYRPSAAIILNDD